MSLTRDVRKVENAFVFKKYAFPKACRLLQKKQLVKIITTSKPLPGHYFLLYYGGSGRSFPRLGIVVAKKKCRLAVLRNRLKRQVRESFRYHQTLLEGYDIVIVARQSAREASPCGLRECLDRLFLDLAGVSQGS